MYMKHWTKSYNIRPNGNVTTEEEFLRVGYCMLQWGGKRQRYTRILTVARRGLILLSSSLWLLQLVCLTNCPIVRHYFKNVSRAVWRYLFLLATKETASCIPSGNPNSIQSCVLIKKNTKSQAR